VLKFGAMIVDALVACTQPVFVYIPPGGELRGGAWVVVDPTINPAAMEMYADPAGRGGVLEPAGIVNIKFRPRELAQAAARLDPALAALHAAVRVAPRDSPAAAQARAAAKVREAASPRSESVASVPRRWRREKKFAREMMASRAAPLAFSRRRGEINGFRLESTRVSEVGRQICVILTPPLPHLFPRAMLDPLAPGLAARVRRARTPSPASFCKSRTRSPTCTTRPGACSQRVLSTA
jgi:hypothetical protein